MSLKRQRVVGLSSLGSTTLQQRFQGVMAQRALLLRDAFGQLQPSAERTAIVKAMDAVVALASSLPAPLEGPLSRLSAPLLRLTIQFLPPEEHLLCRAVSRTIRDAACHQHSWPQRMVLSQRYRFGYAKWLGVPFPASRPSKSELDRATAAHNLVCEGLIGRLTALHVAAWEETLCRHVEDVAPSLTSLRCQAPLVLRQACPKLTELHLNVDSQASFAYGHAPNLTALSLQQAPDALQRLADNFRGLRDLTLAVDWKLSGGRGGSGGSGGSFDPLLRLPLLRSLSLTVTFTGSGSVSDLAGELAKLAPVATAVALRWFNGDNHPLYDHGTKLLSVLGSFTRLTHVTLSRIAVGANAAQALARCRSLQQVRALSRDATMDAPFVHLLDALPRTVGLRVRATWLLDCAARLRDNSGPDQLREWLGNVNTGRVVAMGAAAALAPSAQTAAATAPADAEAKLALRREMRALLDRVVYEDAADDFVIYPLLARTGSDGKIIFVDD